MSSRAALGLSLVCCLAVLLLGGAAAAQPVPDFVALPSSGDGPLLQPATGHQS